MIFYPAFLRLYQHATYMPNTFALITLITESVISSWKIFKSPYLGHYNDTRHYLSEDAGYEISIHVNQIHGPGEPEFIAHQNEPVISISFVEFCLRLYVYCDNNWRWTRAIGRETVYYMRRPLRIIYLLMAGRKPIFS